MRISPRLREAVARVAEDDDRTISHTVVRMIEDWLRAYRPGLLRIPEDGNTVEEQVTVNEPKWEGR